MILSLVQGHLGDTSAEGLGSKNTVEPKAFNSTRRVFIEGARHDRDGR